MQDLNGLDFNAWRGQRKQDIDQALAAAIAGQGEGHGPHLGRLLEAINRSLTLGGKRLRPLLALSAALAVGGAEAEALPAALAVEMVHAYSLIHDDLPAMDNDDLRRGQPTCHKVYGEGTAILAGDALLTLAFEVLAQAGAEGDPAKARRVNLAVIRLAEAAGALGMVGGQMIDLAFETHKPANADEVRHMEILKTGRMISASLVMGGIMAGAGEGHLAVLAEIGRQAGLAFQIVDDILDVEGDPEVFGKPIGSDDEKNKASFVKMVTMEEAKAEAHKLHARALELAESFGHRADRLKGLLELMSQRKS